MNLSRHAREQLARLGEPTIQTDRHFDMKRVQAFPNLGDIKAASEKWKRECANADLDTHAGCQRVVRR